MHINFLTVKKIMSPFKIWIKDRQTKVQKHSFDGPSRSQAKDKFSATKNVTHIDIIMLTTTVYIQNEMSQEEKPLLSFNIHCNTLYCNHLGAQALKKWILKYKHKGE